MCQVRWFEITCGYNPVTDTFTYQVTDPAGAGAAAELLAEGEDLPLPVFWEQLEFDLYGLADRESSRYFSADQCLDNDGNDDVLEEGVIED